VALCALRCREPVACRLLLQLTLAQMKLGVLKTWIEHGVCSCPFGDGASEPREGAEGPAAAAIANGERPAPGRCGQFHGLPSRVGSNWCGTIRWANRPAVGSTYTAALGNWARKLEQALALRKKRALQVVPDEPLGEEVETEVTEELEGEA